MTKIKQCVYKDGELMAPTEGEIAAAFTSPNQAPSIDVDHYHRITIQDYGTTGEAVRSNVGKRVKRFFEIMNRVEGYSTLRVDKREHTGRYGHKIVYKIVYVVERTGSPAQNADSPYAGYHQDVRNLRMGR